MLTMETPPDVHTLQPGEARSLCRFCLRPQQPGCLRQLSDDADATSWPDSELSQLYVQLTGEQLLAPIADEDGAAGDEPLCGAGWCDECAQRMRDAARSVAQFREANAFWASYLEARRQSIEIKVECDVADHLKEEVQEEVVEETVHAEVVEVEEVDEVKDALDVLDVQECETATANKRKPSKRKACKDMRNARKHSGDEHKHQHQQERDDNDDDDDDDDHQQHGDHHAYSSDDDKPIIILRTRSKRSQTTAAKAKSTTTAPATAPTAIKRETPPAGAKKRTNEGQVCHICGGVYQFKMERHIEAAHSELTCDMCGRTFNHKVTLRRHFREDHGFQRHTCDVCQRPNLTRSMWLRHMDMHRPIKERLFACDQCGNHYPTLHNLRQHVARVHVHKEVSCAECGKLFHNGVRLRDHMIRHRPKTITCPEPGCPRMFWLVKEMKEHCRTVHEKDRKYVCEVCGKAFLVNAQLKKHHSLGRCRGAGPPRPRAKAPKQLPQPGAPHVLQIPHPAGTASGVLVATQQQQHELPERPVGGETVGLQIAPLQQLQLPPSISAGLLVAHQMLASAQQQQQQQQQHQHHHHHHQPVHQTMTAAVNTIATEPQSLLSQAYLQ